LGELELIDISWRALVKGRRQRRNLSVIWLGRIWPCRIRLCTGKLGIGSVGLALIEGRRQKGGVRCALVKGRGQRRSLSAIWLGRILPRWIRL